MTPSERQRLQNLDDLVLNASSEELKKIQEIDSKTQLEGLSLYDIYMDSRSLINEMRSSENFHS